MSHKKNFLRKRGTPLETTFVNTINANTVFGTGAENYRGMHMREDGSQLYFNIYAGVERFSRMAFSVNGDISSTITVNHFTKWNAQPIGICISEDGTKAYNYQLGATMYQRTITAWNLGTGTSVTTALAVSGAALYHRGMKISADGFTFYIAVTTAPSNGDSIWVIPLGTAYDYSTYGTITYESFFSDLNTHSAGSLIGFVWLNSGNKIIVIGTLGILLFYTLSTPYDISTRVFVNAVDVSTASNACEIQQYNDQYIYVLHEDGELRQYSITF